MILEQWCFFFVDISLLSQCDISSLTASDLLPYDADVWLLSPACQPYTVLNPNAKGEADPRAKSFINLMTVVLPELAAQNKEPHYILVENVAGFEVFVVVHWSQRLHLYLTVGIYLRNLPLDKPFLQSFNHYDIMFPSFS